MKLQVTSMSLVMFPTHPLKGKRQQSLGYETKYIKKRRHIGPTPAIVDCSFI